MVQLISETNTATATDGRGSGRLKWYRCLLGGHEPITAEDGTESQQFVLEGFNIQVEDPGLFGFYPDGTSVRERLTAKAREVNPQKELVDFWPLSAPPTTWVNV